MRDRAITGPDMASKRPRTNAQEVYDSLRKDIAEGNLRPGDPLVESEIASRFELSRTPIREVLLRLQQDGLIRQGSRGMYVRERSRDEILDTYDARILLEVQAARYAAQRHTEIDEMVLKATCDSMGAIDPADVPALGRASLAFHEAIWTASHSRALYDLLSRLQSHLAQFREITLEYPGRLESALNEHHELLVAVLEGDSERAGEVARSHLVAGRDIRLAVWREEAPPF